jgi:hypothetical protein
VRRIAAVAASAEGESQDEGREAPHGDRSTAPRWGGQVRLPPSR